MSEKKTLAGIAKLIMGVAGFWIAVALVLPWMQTLPVIRPVMDIIIAADLDANQYFYTQSEETFTAQSHMRSGIRRSEQ
ncbi:hypothetical protein [Desulfobotulus mexicanus]|uniref:Uncharacterized protein n=1 Tax=Desulfobotulus mexicanus TaxID=2586642 RepID=A0A5Q4VD72_9BACT|nr:hypothetical protein [Desulfobotulus mexicanus]TYT75654.1 hypothetical protein FIM25_04240 [Desulfobotulus mexicanus]